MKKKKINTQEQITIEYLWDIIKRMLGEWRERMRG